MSLGSSIIGVGGDGGVGFRGMGDGRDKGR